MNMESDHCFAHHWLWYICNPILCHYTGHWCYSYIFNSIEKSGSM